MDAVPLGRMCPGTSESGEESLAGLLSIKTPSAKCNCYMESVVSVALKQYTSGTRAADSGDCCGYVGSIRDYTRPSPYYPAGEYPTQVISLDSDPWAQRKIARTPSFMIRSVLTTTLVQYRFQILKCNGEMEYKFGIYGSWHFFQIRRRLQQHDTKEDTTRRADLTLIAVY